VVKVADVMSRSVFSVQREATLREVVESLATQHVTGAPVLDAKHKLVGTISTSDILQAESEGADLDSTTAGDVMTPRALTVTPDTALREAALAMEYGEVHRLFVEEAGTLVGVVSRSDVSRALANGML
jgi:predicted transcriptional regulator